MKIKFWIAGLLFWALSGNSAIAQNGTDWFHHAKATAIHQLKEAAAVYKPGLNPRSVNPDGTVRLAPQRDWTTGFFPGSLWFGYELTGDEQLKKSADKFTLALDSMGSFRYTHDLGFMIFTSYGNAYRLTGDKKYLNTLKDGAANLSSRYNEQVGAIRSWDFGPWEFPVIIDNMMNLEYLFWASKKYGNERYYDEAQQHALTTLRNHFRTDYSSYHVVSYDTLSGRAVEKGTHQGLTDESAWARGQAWGLYGFTMVYRETHNKIFLDFAKNIARYIMTQPNTPEDKVPYWDYDIPNAGDRAPRDASAAAVIASALLELYTSTGDGDYLHYAEDILKSLSSPKYLAAEGTNNDFILKHSVGAFLYNSEIDTPINYADYYYLEALLRYGRIKNLK